MELQNLVKSLIKLLRYPLCRLSTMINGGLKLDKQTLDMTRLLGCCRSYSTVHCLRKLSMIYCPRSSLVHHKWRVGKTLFFEMMLNKKDIYISLKCSHFDIYINLYLINMFLISIKLFYLTDYQNCVLVQNQVLPILWTFIRHKCIRCNWEYN